ncbi:MAG: response regulator transcription factor [Chloroflexi bacterium]|nr:response regulator transcription factor [Chloroflexota bacterium]
MTKIRVLLADDHLILREGIRALLQREPDIEVVGEASDGREAVAKAGQLLPDIVLMDITMPGLNGLEATQEIKKKSPQVKVLILTMHETSQYLAGMLKADASGYVVKTATTTELISAIKAVNQGDVYLYPSITRMLVEDYLQRAKAGEEKTSYEGLTSREREILRYVSEDKKNKEIAELLGISVRTVQAHRTNLMEKLGAHDRTELVKYAIRKGIIDLQ